MAEADGIRAWVVHDRDPFRGSKGGRRFGQGYNDVRASADEVRGERRHLIGIFVAAPPELEDQVLAFHVADSRTAAGSPSAPPRAQA